MDKEYGSLLNSYKRMFEMVDAIHFNSQNTADVYGQYIDVPKESMVVPITHSGVIDHRRIRKYNPLVLRLGFIGSEAPYKGFPMLKRVIKKLDDEGMEKNIHLSVYGGRRCIDAELANIEYKGRFNAVQMPKVYDEMDLLVVPSICNETFSLTTIEALQYGVPVLVSSKVGAKDIVKQFAPDFVFDTEEELYEILRLLINSREKLEQYNEKVVACPWQWSIKEHAENLARKLYQRGGGYINEENL